MKNCNINEIPNEDMLKTFEWAWKKAQKSAIKKLEKMIAKDVQGCDIGSAYVCIDIGSRTKLGKILLNQAGFDKRYGYRGSYRGMTRFGGINVGDGQDMNYNVAVAETMAKSLARSLSIETSVERIYG